MGEQVDVERERHPATAGARHTIGAIAVSFAFLFAAVQQSGARPGLVAQRDRADRLGRQVTDSRSSIRELQTRILTLAAEVRRAEHALGVLQARLLEAQRSQAAAQGELDAVQARLDERARQAFELMGPGMSAAYLLGSSSLGDLLDRTFMLGRVEQADAALASDVRSRTDRIETSERELNQAARARTVLLARLDVRQAELLDAFTAQQKALANLVSERRTALRHVRRLEAVRSGALPFGAWAKRFLEAIGAPSCRENLVVVVAWQANEFTAARWNPLASTHVMPGSTSFNQVGVQSYHSLAQGIKASEQTLTNGSPSYGYGAILDDLHACVTALNTAVAINASAWCRDCSNGGYVTELVPIVELYFHRYRSIHG